MWGGYAQETKSVTCTLGKDANSCISTGDCTVTWNYSSNPTTTNQAKNGMYWAIGKNGEVTLTAKLGASDATITSVVITAYTNGGTGKTIEATVGGKTFGKEITLTNSSTDYTLEGSASGDLALIMKSTSSKKSHIVKTVIINYTDASSSNKTATTLTFPQESFSFATTDNLTSFTGQKATLTAEGAGLIGKTITYSKTGDDIFSSFNEADGTLALNGNAGTATVTAKFDGTNDEIYNSSSASYTITVNKVYGSLADLKKDITKAEKTFTLRLTNAVVSYAVGDRVYIEDETTGILIYYTNASNDLKAGQKLNGDVTVKAETYYNLPEITAWTPITLTAVDGSDIPLTKLTIADLVNDYDKYEGRRIILENATVTTGTTGGDRAESGKISQGENEITLRTVAGIKTTKDDVIDVIGFLGKYNTGLQYNVFSQDDITVKSSVEATTLSFDTEVTEFNVEKGKEKTFTAPKATVKTTATGEIVEGAKVTYESNAPTVAAVDAEGNVTFGSVFGTATITASYSGDATHRASKNSYTINYGKIKPTMAWSATEVTVNLGEKFTNAPKLSLTADNVSILEGKTITYTSTDENVAMVDVNGTVDLMDKEGTTTITATFAGDDTYAKASASYTLTVKDPNKLEVTFDFANNKYGYGTSKNNDGVGDVPVNGTIVSDNRIVTITNLQNGTNNTTFYADNLRFYNESKTSISVPEGYVLKKIISSANMVGNSYATWTSGEKGETEKEWVATKDVNSVTFTANATIKMANMTVYYANATSEATSGTINFIAQNAEGYYATFSSDKDVVFTEDVVVSSVSITNGKLKVTDLTSVSYDVTDAEKGNVNGYYVPANTGVLVNCLDKSATYYFPKTTQSVTLPANQLKPAPVGGGVFTADPEYKYYKLAYDNYTDKTGLGFYWGAEDAGAFNVKAGTAYLAVPTSEANNAKGFAFDGETTGVENVNVAANQSKTIYNLNGQRVSNMSQAGLYIVNGKKVVIRK